LTTYDNVVTPSFSELNAMTQSEPDLRDICGEVSEWLAMVSIRSRRVSATDSIDPYLCRYVAPEISGKAAIATDLISLKWGGLIPPHWITQLFITLLYVLLYSVYNGTT
jgi:ribonuclease P/MRP protein subunit RPP40